VSGVERASTSHAVRVRVGCAQSRARVWHRQSTCARRVQISPAFFATRSRWRVRGLAFARNAWPMLRADTAAGVLQASKCSTDPKRAKWGNLFLFARRNQRTPPSGLRAHHSQPCNVCARRSRAVSDQCRPRRCSLVRLGQIFVPAFFDLVEMARQRLSFCAQCIAGVTGMQGRSCPAGE
jgi:hypothetical protein